MLGIGVERQLAQGSLAFGAERERFLLGVLAAVQAVVGRITRFSFPCRLHGEVSLILVDGGPVLPVCVVAKSFPGKGNVAVDGFLL